MVGATNAGMQLLHSNRLTVPGDLALLFRVLVRLQGLGGALGAQVSLTELLQPYLRKMAAERLDPRTVGRQAVRNLRGWQRVLADAPRTIRPLLQHLKDGTVHVELEIHDADGVADRLTDGLLGSASLLASAQLLSRGTGPRIGPVSAPGAIALAVGVLTWRRLVRGRAGYQSPLSRVQQLIRPVHR
jgi:ubiquinone biosynthesis protein